MKEKVAVYIPIMDDPVDCKLANFVNNFPDRNKLKLMFMRESAGKYEYGTKRVEIRVVQGKLQVRVGGGYLTIDEFLDQYMTIELQKVERRDPLKKFAGQLALAKSIQNGDVSPLNLNTQGKF